MARNLQPQTKRIRRIGEKVISHGEKAYNRRPYPPGQHGPKGSSRLSEYGVRLKEKQKAQLIYGLLERQFRRYVTEARRKVGDTAQHLYRLLELRLDSVVFRCGFAPTHEAARQLVRHGHITVNGSRVDIPSYTVRSGDVIGVLESTKKREFFTTVSKFLENYESPSWIRLDKAATTATVLSDPSQDETIIGINPQLIVEFYSR